MHAGLVAREVTPARGMRVIVDDLRGLLCVVKDNTASGVGVYHESPLEARAAKAGGHESKRCARLPENLTWTLQRQ